MQGYRPGIQASLPAKPVGRQAVDRDTKQGQAQHARRIGLDRIPQARDRLRDDIGGARYQDEGVRQRADQGEPAIPKGEPVIASPEAQTLQNPGQGQGDAIAQIMKRVRQNGQAPGEKAADKFHQRKPGIEQKRHLQVGGAVGAVRMQVAMHVRMLMMVLSVYVCHSPAPLPRSGYPLLSSGDRDEANRLAPEC